MTGKWLICLLACLLAIPPAIAQNYGNIKPNTVIGNPDPSSSKPAIPRQFDFYSPMDFGAKGNGTTDDTVAMQKAINAAAHGGTLVLGPRLYAIASNLTASGPIHIVGSYGGGGQAGWTSPFGTCTTGIRATTVNEIVLVINGSGTTVKDVCFDAYGLTNTTGTAIQVTNATPSTPLSNILIEGNQFNGFCTSIDATAKPSSPADPTQLVDMRIIRNGFQPANGACNVVWVGRLSYGGKTTDTQIYNNSFWCPFDGGANHSISTTNGVYLEDSGGSIHRGNQIVACNYGTLLRPGAHQAVNGFFFDNTVVGDTSNSSDLFIDTTDPTAIVNSGKFVGVWAASATGPSVVIQNTGGGTIRGINFTGTNIYPRAAYNGINIAAGDDINFVGGSVCAQDPSTQTMINITTPGAVGIHSSLIGACESPNSGYTVSTGINYAPQTAGKIAITGNQIYAGISGFQVITYAPVVQPANAVIANNVGLDDVPTISAASAPTMTIPVNPTFTVTGTATIQTINGGWKGRCVDIVPSGAWSTVTGGNINPAFTALIGEIVRGCYSGTTWYFTHP